MRHPSARPRASGGPLISHVPAWVTWSVPRSTSATAAIALALLVVWWAAGLWYDQQLTAKTRAEVSVLLSSRAAGLQTAIGERFALLDGMVGLVESQPTVEAMDSSFEPFAASLLASSSSSAIRNFALFPDGIIRYEYPITGNVVPEAYRNLYNHPVAENRESVQRTLATHSVALGQPRELGQGGLGLVATKAVFQHGQLWGFVTMALDIPPILAEAGVVADNEQEHLQMALADGLGRVFFGSPQPITTDAESIAVPLPEGTWRLYAAPLSGWSDATLDNLRAFQVSSLVAVLLLTLLAWLMLSRHERLLFETQRLERLQAAERAALAQAERSRDESESARLRIEEAAQAEQAARSQAEEALATRDIFLRTLAHDLMTPLVGLAWQVQLMQKALHDRPNDLAYVASLLDNVSAQTAEAVAAIEELHDLTRAAAGAPLRLNLGRLDLAETVRHVVAALPPSSAAEVQCEGEQSDVIVNADPARLARIIRNVLDNALKFSPNGGVVVVSVQKLGDWAEMRVVDHGLGIPSEDLPHVFERYRRGTNVEHTYGEGLGLASVQHLVELHGGQVLVESEVGVGSVFTIRLPLAV